MSDNNGSFMDKLRARIARREEENNARLEEILARDDDAGKSRSRKTAWVNDPGNSDEPVSSSPDKASILDLLRDKVRTKSSSQRGGSDE